MQRTRRPSRQPVAAVAFTLIELLVVIGVIAILIGILVPTLIIVRRYAQATTCTTNLRTIGLAVRLYALANRDVLSRSTDQVLWTKSWQPPSTPTPTLRLIDSRDSQAYWGVAYFPYMADRAIVDAEGPDAAMIVDAARKIWLCPSSGGVSNQFSNTDPTNPVSYGINGRITGTTLPRDRKLASYRPASGVILAHDSVEPRMEDRSGDSLSDYGGGTNLWHWRPGGLSFVNGYHLDPLAEYYRHRRRANVLYIDGHVGTIAESLGADVPSWAYEGK